MRWRAVAGALGAAVLAGAVLTLREQVPPPTPRVPPSVATPVVAIADPGLPVRDPVFTPRWRTHTVPRGVIDGVSNQQHLLYTHAGSEGLELVVQLRDTGQQVFRRPITADDPPWASLLHGGLLLLVHGRQQVVLDAIDPATGQVRQLAPPAGYGLRPWLVGLGDEVLLPGWQAESQHGCVLAIQPATGASRVAWCAEQGRTQTWLYAGVDAVAWPAAVGPTGCVEWQRLRAGGVAETVSRTVALCAARALIEIDGWQVAQRPERNVLQPMIIAGDGSRQLELGTTAAFVGCGRHVYWSAATQGFNPDTVYRWLPGDDHREIAYRLESSSRFTLAAPRCADGVLSVAVTTANDGNPRLVELRSIGRP